MASINERASEYQRLADEAGDRLEQQLANVRKDTDEGTITVLEAANERVRLLEDHLAAIQLLRDEYLK
jgi:hypothetical protein